MPHQNQAKRHIRIKPNATSELGQMPHQNQAKRHIRIKPNATSELGQTPHQNQAKCHIRIKPNATSELSQTPHWSGKLACFKEKHTITASGRTWMLSVIAIIPNDVYDWFRPMANTRTSIFVCYCHRLWCNAPPHSVLIIRPFSASEPPIKYHWAAQ